MPITTSENDIKERLSTAYVAAVAARAGLQLVAWPLDKESVDLTLRAVSGTRACLDLQVKATSADVIDETGAVLDLPLKNYDDLRDKPQTHPHYLVVLHLPARRLAEADTRAIDDPGIGGMGQLGRHAGKAELHVCTRTDSALTALHTGVIGAYDRGCAERAR